MLKVAVDIDGVLADLYGRFLYLINKDFGTNYATKDLEHWNVFDMLPVLKELKEKYVQKTAESIGWRYFDLAWLSPHKLKPVTGAVEAMKKLVERKDLQLDIVTSRRVHSVPDMIKWIDLHGLPYHTIVILDTFNPNYPADKARLDYDIYIDDSPGLARKIANQMGKKLLLFDYPTNKFEFTENVIRVQGWDDVLAYFDKIPHQS